MTKKKVFDYTDDEIQDIEAMNEVFEWVGSSFPDYFSLQKEGDFPTVTVKNNAEFHDLPKRFKERTSVVVNSAKPIKITYTPFFAHVEIVGKTTGQVCRFAKVKIKDSAKIKMRQSSQGVAHDNVELYMRENTRAAFKDNSKGHLTKKANGIFMDKSSGVLTGDSFGEARDESSVEVKDRGRILGKDKSKITLRDHGICDVLSRECVVNAFGCSVCYENEPANIKLHDKAICFSKFRGGKGFIKI